MKKIFCFVIILVGCQLGIIRDSFATPIEAEKKLKADIDFAQWPGKNEPMRVPVLLNELQFPDITNRPPSTRRSVKHGNTVNAVVGVGHRYIWTSPSKENRLEINVFIGSSSAEAHEYLIWQFVNNSAPYAMQLKWAKRTDIHQIGHICFADGEKNGNRFGRIDFIRNNIVINIRARGSEFEKETRAIAEAIDRQLLKEETGSAASAYYDQEFQRVSDNERRGIREKITQ